MIITAENHTQNPSGTLINAVETLRKTVNSVMNSAVDSPITSGLYHARAVNQPPSMTGKTGSTHGASTLIAHARNARIPKDIIYKTK